MINVAVQYMNREELNNVLHLNPKTRDEKKALEAKKKELLKDINESNEFEMFMYACYKTEFPITSSECDRVSVITNAFNKKKCICHIDRDRGTDNIKVRFKKYDKPCFVVKIKDSSSERSIQKAFFKRLKDEQARRMGLQYDLSAVEEAIRMRYPDEGVK